MKVEPYLFFEGTCEQAIEFYRKALTAELQTLMRLERAPQPPQCCGMPIDRFDIGWTVDMEEKLSGSQRVRAYSAAWAQIIQRSGLQPQ